MHSKTPAEAGVYGSYAGFAGEISKGFLRRRKHRKRN